MAESSTVDSTVSTVEDIDNESEQDYSDVEAEPPKRRQNFTNKSTTLYGKKILMAISCQEFPLQSIL